MSPWRGTILITHLTLINIRNYERLELDLGPGISLFQGMNGQGKSNLLEAVYMLAIAKSPRATSDREVIRWQAARENGYSQVSATLERGGETLRIRMDFALNQQAPSDGGPGEAGARGPGAFTIGKRIRVNGVPRLSSDLVGEVNAVMFSAQDIHLVDGPPTERRRYLDILISQVDRAYLRALQKYQRVVSQRNHLLRLIRDGRAQEQEMEYWDNELVAEGKYIVVRRHQIIQELATAAGSAHRKLTGGGESLELAYRPSVGEETCGTIEEVEEAFRRALAAYRRREIAQGMSLVGPHRDDLQLLIDGMDAGAYASRGQTRTAALSLRLAEADYLRHQRGQEPILLLDDVLSEMDKSRRDQVLEAAAQHQQTLITTTDLDFLDRRYLSQMAVFSVHGGTVTPMERLDLPEG